MNRISHLFPADENDAFCITRQQIYMIVDSDAWAADENEAAQRNAQSADE